MGRTFVFSSKNDFQIKVQYQQSAKKRKKERIGREE